MPFCSGTDPDASIDGANPSAFSHAGVLRYRLYACTPSAGSGRIRLDLRLVQEARAVFVLGAGHTVLRDYDEQNIINYSYRYSFSFDQLFTCGRRNDQTIGCDGFFQGEYLSVGGLWSRR